MTFKPLLAAKLKDPTGVRFPVYCTPKLDGIRCLVLPDGQVVSRTLKPIPNRHIRETIAALGVTHLDGEIMIPNAECFGDVTRAVMSREGEPEFCYLIFDNFRCPRAPYRDRVREIWNRREDFIGTAAALLPKRADSLDDLMRLEQSFLNQGHEGLMFRSADAIYKFGRSTLREQYLVALKRFEDAEGTVVGYYELEHNENEQTVDALGHAKRSTHAAGKRLGGVLGGLVIRLDDGTEFNLGGGYTTKQRADLFALGDKLIGRRWKFKHQGYGAKEKPRCPVSLGERHEDDL